MTDNTFLRYTGREEHNWTYQDFVNTLNQDVQEMFRPRNRGAPSSRTSLARLRNVLGGLNEFMHLHALPDGVGRTYLVWLQFECWRNGWPFVSAITLQWNDLPGIKTESEVLNAVLSSMEATNKAMRRIADRRNLVAPSCPRP
jgi:hypothetical protein